MEAECVQCQKRFGYYESQVRNLRDDVREWYRVVCASCRQRVVGQVTGHHLSAEWAIRLTMADRCDLCQRALPIGKHMTPVAHVDHDHACCPGTRSCGLCVRGILCPTCNTRSGVVEALIREGVDVDSVVAWVKGNHTALKNDRTAW